LNLEPIETPATTAVRNSVDEVYTQMFEDVQFAIDNLPSSAKPSSHATHWAAKAFMARLCLYYASEYGKTEYFAKASQMAEDVITNSGKSLYDNYSDVWDMAKSTTTRNNEFIWAIDYYDVIDPSTPYNYLPPRLNGTWDGLIARRQTTESGGSGGNILHLMVTPLWQSQSDAVGGPVISSDVLQRICGPNPNSFYTVASPNTKVTVDVGYWYVKYGLGYTRFAPTRYCLDIFNETMDQRYNGTFLTAWYKHPGLVPKSYGTSSCSYPDMSN
jgi:hypothetical protein